MAIIKSADQAFADAAQNKLRRYPAANAGKGRLIPFALPTINTDKSISKDAKYFVAGDCFARSVEKALISAGKQVISSPDNLPLPGNSVEQFNRFTLYNIDTIYNELRWALEPDDEDMYGSLIEMGDELCDLQIQWTFSHRPEIAKKYRKTFATSFAAAAEADVIVLVVGGIEQWYDKQTGLYINGMVPNNVVAAYPDRFELHMMEQDDCVNSIQRVYDLLLRTSKTDPLILVMNTPGAEPFTFSNNDALIEHLYSRSLQRLALDSFVKQAEHAEYVPAMEYVFLSERRVTYLPNSYNHITQDCVDRLMAEVLLRYEGPSAGQSLLQVRGLVDGLIALEQYEDAVPLLEAYLQEHADDPSVDNTYLHLSVTHAYQNAGRHYELAQFQTDLYRKQHSPEKDTLAARYCLTLEHSFQLAVGSAMKCGDKALIKELSELGKKHGADPELLERLSLRLSRKSKDTDTTPDAPRPIRAASGDKVSLAMQEVSALLRSNPKQCSTVAKAWIEQGVNNDQITWMYALALRATGDRDAIKIFREIASSESEFSTQANVVGAALEKSMQN